MANAKGNNISKIALLICAPVVLLLLSGGFLGIARFLREQREMKDFTLIQSISSPSGKEFALHFEHVPQSAAKNERAPEEIVVVDSRSKISIPELWTRMKANEAVLIENGSSSEKIRLVWSSGASLRVECSDCTGSSIELLRRAPSVGQISIEYVGFPKDASYTNVEAVEK